MGRAATGCGDRPRGGGRARGDGHPPAAGDDALRHGEGYGKRTAVEEYRNQSRGGKGVITLK